MHMPFALAPLSIDYVTAICDGMGYGHVRLDAPFRLMVRYWHGYTYLAVRYLVPEPHGPAFEAFTERKRAFIDESDAYWARSLPVLQETRAWFRALLVETMAPEELAAAWTEAWERGDRAWQIHFVAIRGAYQITDDLSEFYESVVAGAPPGEALRLVQGRAGVLHDVERGLDRLAGLVLGSAALHPMFLAAVPPTLAEVEAMPEAAAFVAELRGFLAEHGHLGGTFDDLAFPSWIEEPSIVFGDIARLLASEAPSADERQATLLEDAEQLADRVRATLADRPEELERFEALLEAGRRVGPLTEIHNYWIDRLVQSLLRALAMRVGGRLVEAGVIDEAADILYLWRDEVGPLIVAPADRRALVAERRSTHERQRSMQPPATVGKPMTPPAEPDRFDGARYEASEDGSLRGTGASAGIARGAARVVLGPGDFAKVRPGDVIVAPSSNPSWMPLFMIAGGVLCNTGGVLSHAAVVAREVGLPAVVGLGDATTRIADGSLVELDGTTGFVRIL